MRPVMAFIDERAIAQGFKPGDVVQKSNLRDMLPSPYYGRVIYPNCDTGVVVVQWPWGAEQEQPSCLIPIPDEKSVLDLDQWYSNWDAESHGAYGESAARVASEYERATLPMWRMACKAMHRGMNEFEAFKQVGSEFSCQFGTDSVRRTVANLYETARRLAVYWHDSKRRYRVTRKERESGVFTCPRCKSPLKPRTFRQNQRVLACKTCGFTIHPRDVVTS